MKGTKFGLAAVVALFLCWPILASAAWTINGYYTTSTAAKAACDAYYATGPFGGSTLCGTSVQNSACGTAYTYWGIRKSSDSSVGACYEFAVSCPVGMVEFPVGSGTCAVKPTCTAPMVYLSASNTCGCSSGFHLSGSSCVADDVSCTAPQVRDAATNTCIACSTGTQYSSGSCVPITCTAPQIFDASTNSCVNHCSRAAGEVDSMEDYLVRTGMSTVTYCDGICKYHLLWDNAASDCFHYADAPTKEYCGFLKTYTGETCNAANNPEGAPAGQPGGPSPTPGAVCPPGTTLDAASGLCGTPGSSSTPSTPDAPGTPGSPGTTTCPAGYAEDPVTHNCVGVGPVPSAGCPQGYVISGGHCVSKGPLSDGPYGSGAGTGPNSVGSCGGVGQPRCTIDWGEGTLPDAPVSPYTGEDVGAMMNYGPFKSFLEWSPSLPAGECPTASWSMFDRQYTFDGHCSFADNIRGLLSAAMALVWGITAVFIILSA